MLSLILIGTSIALEECKPVAEPRDIPCRVTSTWNYTPPCSDYNITVWNQTGDNVKNYTMGDFSTSGLCNFTFDISNAGSYKHINPRNGDVGDILVEADDKVMAFGIIIFLMSLNIIVFILPFIVNKFSNSEAANYIIKRLIWLTSIILLWYNMTIFRTMASDFGLGIDNFLYGLWLFFTLGMFVVVFLMVYYTTVGAIKLAHEAKLKRQMGYDGEE